MSFSNLSRQLRLRCINSNYLRLVPQTKNVQVQTRSFARFGQNKKYVRNQLSRFTQLKLCSQKGKLVLLGSAVPFLGFDFHIPWAVLHSQFVSLTSADKVIIELPINTYVRPNDGDDKLKVDVYLEGAHISVTDEERKWIESLEVSEDYITGLPILDKLLHISTVKISFKNKLSTPYPPVYCVIHIPASIYYLDASMQKKSNITITDTLLPGEITVKTLGGNCAMKNNQSHLVNVKTENGMCNVENSHSLKLNVITGSGDCVFKKCSASLDITTTSGNVVMSNNKSTFLGVATGSGNCHASNNTCKILEINTARGYCLAENNDANILNAWSEKGTCKGINNTFLQGAGCTMAAEPEWGAPV